MATSSSSTSSRTQLFLQSVKIGDTEIPRSMIARSTYIEIADLSGPQLELEIRDGTGYLVDTLGVKHGTVLTCSMGDPQGLGNTSFTETFYVLKAPHEADMVRVIAFSEKVKRLKDFAAAPQFFVKKQPATIVKALAGSLAVDADTFKKLGTYHLNMGQTPASVLSRMAQEAGALCWSSRGIIHIKSMATLASAKPTLTYEANNSKATMLINRFSKLNQDQLYAQSRQFRYMAYSLTGGLLTAGNKAWPVKMVSADDQTALNNMAMFLMPKFDMEVTGNAALTPGMVIKVLVHTYDATSGLDESVPTKMIVERVAHQEDRFGYNCRAVLGVISDGTD